MQTDIPFLGVAEAGAEGHPTGEPPCRILFLDSAHNQADNGIATDSDFHNFQKCYVQPFSRPCCIRGEKKVQLKASLLSGSVGEKMEVSDDKLSASFVCNEVRFAFLKFS